MEKDKSYYAGVLDALLAVMGKSVEAQKSYVDKIKSEIEKGGFTHVKRKRVGGKYKVNRGWYQVLPSHRSFGST